MTPEKAKVELEQGYPVVSIVPRPSRIIEAIIANW